MPKFALAPDSQKALQRDLAASGLTPAQIQALIQLFVTVVTGLISIFGSPTPNPTQAP